MCGVLRARQAGIQTLDLVLCHLRGPATRVRLALLQASRTPRHLLTLLRERLERVRLPAPVVGLELRSGEFRSLVQPSTELFGDMAREARATPDRVAQLVERLRARLGEQAVFGVRLVPEHRPEAAWRAIDPVFMRPAQTELRDPVRRPLWMLAEPQALTVEHGQPCHGGRLDIESGPERIETGWWDGHDAARDYYVARQSRGARLWIFRERRGERRWFLQGVFG